jgi:hypothetical protein
MPHLIPASPAHKLLLGLNTETGLLDKFAHQLSVSTPILEHQIFGPVLTGLANYCSAAPFSNEAFREPSGALRFAIRTASHAVQMCGAVVFSTVTQAEQRVRDETNARYITAIAAMVCVASKMHVKTEVLTDQGTVWPSMGALPLNTWAQQQNVPAFTVRWRTGAPKPFPKAFAGLVLAGIAPISLFSELGDAMMLALLKSINALDPEPGTHDGPIESLLRSAYQKVHDFEVSNIEQAYEPTPRPRNNQDFDAPESTSPFSQQPAPQAQPAVVISPILTVADIEPRAPAASDFRAGLAPELGEWADSIRDAFASSPPKDTVRWAKEGLVVPVNVVGGFGASARRVTEWLEGHQLLAQKQGASLVLRAELGQYILPK